MLQHVGNPLCQNPVRFSNDIFASTLIKRYLLQGSMSILEPLALGTLNWFFDVLCIFLKPHYIEKNMCKQGVQRLSKSNKPENTTGEDVRTSQTRLIFVLGIPKAI